jgi:hypothetical protein
VQAKGALGLPGDDWGIHMHRQLAKALKLNPAAYVRTHGTQDYEQCGSVFAPGAVTCQSVSDAKPYTFGLLGLGALGILISFTASGEKTIHLN